MCRPFRLIRLIIPNLIITRITTHIMVIIRVFRSDGAGTVAVGVAAAGAAAVVGTVVVVAAGMAAVVIVKRCFRVGLVNKTEFA